MRVARLRICTKRCRCHTSCRRSRFSASGTQIRGKRSSSSRSQQQLRILSIRLLLAHSFRADLGGVPDPQVKLQVPQQPLEPARVPTGLHPHPHLQTLLLQLAIELLRFFAVKQPPFAQLARVDIYQCNLLEARMIITTYNQHVRLLSSEPFGCLRFQSLLGRWEPTLLWNHFTNDPLPLGAPPPRSAG